VLLGCVLVFAPARGLLLSQLMLLGLAAIVISAYAVVLHEQLSAHPWLKSAAPHPIWGEAGAALKVPLQPLVSIARNRPYFEIGRPLASIMALIGGFLIGAQRRRAKLLMKAIAWSGAAYAAYGIIAHLADPTQLLWREKEAYVSVLTGTFVNRNTAAIYFGTAAVLWLLLLAERVRQHLPPREIEWRRAVDLFLSRTPKEIIIAFSMLFICLAAMFMTGSRAGVVLSLCGLVVAFTLYFRRDLAGWRAIFIAAAGASAVALLLLEIMGAGVNGRADLISTPDEGRLETYRSTLRLIADHPWFGTGLGTFSLSFPAYRSSKVSMWGVWDIAHNTLLEVAADMGIPVACLLVIAWAIGFAVLARGAIAARHHRTVPIASFVIALLAAAHSLVDFSLQIPGYAIVAFALIGAGLSQSCSALQENSKLRTFAPEQPRCSVEA